MWICSIVCVHIKVPFSISYISVQTCCMNILVWVCSVKKAGHLCYKKCIGKWGEMLFFVCSQNLKNFFSCLSKYMHIYNIGRNFSS